MGIVGDQSIEESVHGFPDPGHQWNGRVHVSVNVQWKGISDIGGNEPIQIDPEEVTGRDIHVMGQAFPGGCAWMMKIMGHGTSS